MPDLSDLRPVRVEVKFFGGTGHRERFGSVGQAVAWLESAEFLGTAHRVRSVLIVAPHDVYQADPDWGQRRRDRADGTDQAAVMLPRRGAV